MASDTNMSPAMATDISLAPPVASDTITLPSPSPLDTAQLYAAVKPSVVLIQTDQGLGAGFVVKNKRLVATAYHVIAGAKKITVISRSGIHYKATPYAWKIEADIAIIELDREFEDAEPLPLRLEDPLGVGMPVVMVGHPFGDYAESYEDLEGLLTWTITSGIVGGISERFIQTDAASSPGNSGGPILDMRGRVIGVVSARLDGAEGLTFSVPVVRLQDLLDNPGTLEMPKPEGDVVLGLSGTTISTEGGLWMGGVALGFDRSPPNFGLRFGGSIGYNRVKELPEASTLFTFSEESYWAQWQVGLKLLSGFGFGSLDPFIGLRGGWMSREKVSIAANLEDPSCQFEGSEPCELEIFFNTSTSERGLNAMGLGGLEWRSELLSLRVTGFVDLLQTPKLRLGLGTTLWF